MKIQQILLLLSLLLLIACGSEPEPTPTPLTMVEEPTAEPTIQVAPTEEPTPEPTETTVPTNTPEPTATDEPTPEPTAESTATSTAVPNLAVTNGISFVIPEELAWDIETSAIEATPIDNNPMRHTVAPAHQQFAISGELPEAVLPAALRVYPIQDYSELNLDAREELEQLFIILAEGEIGQPETLPYLPPIRSAAQIFYTQETFVPFMNGSGVRYLTHYAQDFFTIQDLYYTFQGVTEDGNYLVTAVFPLSTASLDSRPLEWPDDLTNETAISTYNTYLADVKTILANDTDLQQTIAQMDALIASLNVTPDTPELATDSLQLLHPVNGSQFYAGDEVQIEGIAPIEATFSLQVGANEVLSGSLTMTNGRFAQTITLPSNIQGQAQLTVQTANESVRHTLTLTANDQANTPVDIVLDMPFEAETAVAGYPLFFSGTASNIISDTLTVGVLINNCTEFSARQSFTFTGGSWNALVILPENMPEGDACAIAYTGTYGENWREVQTPIQITTLDNAVSSDRLRLGNPFQTTINRADGVISIYGMAANPDNNEVTAILSTQEGEILSETTTTVDTFGYWELDLPITEQTPNLVVLTLRINIDGDPLEFTTGYTLQ